MTGTWNQKLARTRSLTTVEGFRVGHWTDSKNATGCTAILCDQQTIAGVDVRGGATASHELELLYPTGCVEFIQAIMLTGGSAMGLACVHGAVEYLREKQQGFPTQQGHIPIVPAAAIYDLGLGNPDAYPVKENGLHACQSATPEFERGSVGAGTGAVVGKIHGHSNATKGGIGSAGWVTQDGLQVGAIAVVNAFGDIGDPDSSRIIAGARTENNTPLHSADALIDGNQHDIKFGSNTTLCVITTNAKLTKTQASIVSRIAQTGLTRAVWPSHTQYDGDMIFTLSSGDHAADLNRVGVLASRVVEAAICDAVLEATKIGPIPTAEQLGWADQVNQDSRSGDTLE
ncbi:MAG: P1 family peptidase [Phycisphaerales bacterium]